jgi:Flp pilus assembly protein TadG
VVRNSARHSLRRSWLSALGDERGNAMIEAALVIPVVLAVAFGIVTAGRVVHAKIAVQAAAREAGRTLATAASETDGLTVARDRAVAVAGGYGLSPELFTVTLDPGNFARGGTVRANTAYPVPLGDVPLFGHIQVTVSSSHQELIELYRSREAVTP